MSFLNGTDPGLRQTRTPTTQEFTGSGQSSVTLSSDPGSEDNLIITFDGVTQHRSTYSVSGTTVSFSSAVPTGVAKIEATFTTSHKIVTPSDNSVGSAAIAADAVTGAKIGDDQIDSEHYVAGSIDLEHLSSESVDEDNLHISNAGSNGEFLSKQSGNAGGLTWAAAGGAWNLIGTEVADNSGTTLTITGLSSTYDAYAIALCDIVPASDNVDAQFRLGDSSGIDSGGSDYQYHIGGGNSNADTYSGTGSTGTDKIMLNSANAAGVGSDTGEGLQAMLYLTSPSDGTIYPHVYGNVAMIGNGGHNFTGFVSGSRKAVIAVDRVQFKFSSGNVESGRMTVWGIAHA